MESINNLNLTQKQKDQLIKILETTRETRIQKYITRKQNKKANNLKTYQDRKNNFVYCECCNKSFDKYYEKIHNATKKHLKNAESILIDK